MNDDVGHLVAAREHHRASRWVRACEGYAAAERVTPLGIEDLECWAEAAQIIGRVDEAIDVLARCFELRAEAGEIHEATRAAYWLWSVHVFTRGEFAIAAGWVERARGLAARQSGEYGWPLIPQAYGCLGAGDYETAEGLLHRAIELGLGRGDADLVTIATTMCGRTTLKLGSLESGLALLDAAMVRILTRTTSPRATSVMYCAAIGSCYEVHEIARAMEWSVALDTWLAALPQLGGAYFGNCRIYRAILMRLRGDWSRAVAELEQACRDLAIDGQLVAGHAWYELGELRRLQGAPGVENAYQQAIAFGRVAQPGLALYRLSQGDVQAADAGLHRVMAEREPAADRLDASRGGRRGRSRRRPNRLGRRTRSPRWRRSPRPSPRQRHARLWRRPGEPLRWLKAVRLTHWSTSGARSTGGGNWVCPTRRRWSASASLRRAVSSATRTAFGWNSAQPWRPSSGLVPDRTRTAPASSCRTGPSRRPG